MLSAFDLSRTSTRARFAHAHSQQKWQWQAQSRRGLGRVTSAERGQFENQKALQEYAAAHDLEYVWEGMNAFSKRWRLAQLAHPGTYELVEVRTKRGLTRALLFSKAILRAEMEAAAPMREAIRIKRERLAAKMAAKHRNS